MHQVDLSPIYSALNEGLLTLLAGLAIFIGSWVRQWLLAHAAFLGEQTDKTLADGLNRALSNGVQIAMQQVSSVESQHPGLDTKSAIAAWAAQYAVNHSPDAMERFGLDPNDLALKALAYLPTPTMKLDGDTPSVPAKVQVQQLGPVA